MRATIASSFPSWSTSTSKRSGSELSWAAIASMTSSRSAGSSMGRRAESASSRAVDADASLRVASAGEATTAIIAIAATATIAADRGDVELSTVPPHPGPSSGRYRRGPAEWRRFRPRPPRIVRSRRRASSRSRGGSSERRFAGRSEPLRLS